MSETAGAGTRELLSLVVAVLIGAAVTTCASFESGPTAVRIHGLVSNESGLPVRDAEIVVADLEPVHTDIRGRFVITNVPIGRSLASVRHAEYRDVETEIVVTGPADVIHVRLQSLRAARDKTVESTVAAIVRGDLDDARAILATPGGDEGDPRLILLHAVVLWRLGRIAEAQLEITRLERIPDTAAVVSALRGAVKEDSE